MSSRNDKNNRPARQRANTSTFNFSGWRRGRAEATAPTSTPAAAPPVASPPLHWEDLVKALSPPAVPSLIYAKSLANSLAIPGTHSPPPRLSLLQPVLASLCAPDAPAPLQTVGYEILAAFLKSSQAIASTADRLSCLSLFVDAAWSRELWESRTKAFEALVRYGDQTIGMEAQILRMLEGWIERAFDGLLLPRTEGAPDDRLDRQRSVESLTALLIALVRKPELVSRLTDDDTAGVLRLWETLIDKALSLPSDFARSPPASPAIEPQSTKTMLPPKISLSHRRHHSSTSLPELSLVKHPADIVVDAYSNYLLTRLPALTHNYLGPIVPLLFRALAFYVSPLLRLSLEPGFVHPNLLEKLISDILKELVAGPYSSSCRQLMRHHFFPAGDTDLLVSIQASIGALRTLRMSIRRVLEGRLARAYIEQASSMDYSPAGVPSHIPVERELMERAWAKDETAAWDLTRFANVLARASRAWIAQSQDAAPAEVAARKEDVLMEIAGIVKDVIQAMEGQGSEDVDDEEVEAVGRITRELVDYVRSYKYVRPTRSHATAVDCPTKDRRPELCAHLYPSSCRLVAVPRVCGGDSRSRPQDHTPLPRLALHHPLHRRSLTGSRHVPRAGRHG